VGLEGKRPQMSRQLELPLEDRAESSKAKRSEEAPTATHGNERSGTSDLMEWVCERPNLQAALKRVRKNKGSPGIDGMTVDELPDYLRTHWERLRGELLSGTYQQQTVKRQQIPKSGGGMRELGIPTVLDRFIQQALLQVLQPRFDPTFSEHSHGFRPGKRAHDAIVEAQRYIQEGRRWVVDVDLEKFFDRVNHDVLMGKLAKRIEDRRMLRLIRRYLDAGILANGVVTERHEGTPLVAMKERVRLITRRTRGRSVEQIVGELRSYLLGWKEYFRLADTPNVFSVLDEWIRHRLRAIHLKHWKRGTTIYRELRVRGISHIGAARVAANGCRWWRNSGMLIHVAFPIRYFDELGLPRLAA